jgi:periplasmic protein CpxP/Spy
MKFKLLTVLFLTTAAITTTASAIQAQFPPSQAQFPGRQGFPVRGQGKPDFKELGLTEEQMSKLKEVQQESKAAIDEILTLEQRNTLEQAFKAGQKPPEAMESINLSDEQKQKIQEVMESQKQKISEILTPEQQQKLQERMQKKQNRNTPFG